jgi:hypothetical protein
VEGALSEEGRRGDGETRRFEFECGRCAVSVLGWFIVGGAVLMVVLFCLVPVFLEELPGEERWWEEREEDAEIKRRGDGEEEDDD